MLSLVSTKGKKSVNPFKYLNQYCYVKMALIIEGIFIIKTVTSLQVKVHEVYIKPLKPREPLQSKKAIVMMKVIPRKVSKARMTKVKT